MCIYSTHTYREQGERGRGCGERKYRKGTIVLKHPDHMVIACFSLSACCVVQDVFLVAHTVGLCSTIVIYELLFKASGHIADAML